MMFLRRKKLTSNSTRDSSESGHVSGLEKGRKWTARLKTCSYPPLKPKLRLGFPGYFLRVQAISRGGYASLVRPVGDSEHVAGPFFRFFGGAVKSKSQEVIYE